MRLRLRPPGARKRRSERTDSGEPIQRPSARHGYVPCPDGTRIFYSVEGQGKPMVFCYGLVCSSLHWTYQIDYFRKNYQVIWFDYRGHQNSDTPKDLSSLTIEQFAKDLLLVLEELSIEDAVLLGHSMGASVALQAARIQPERFRSLVLANGAVKRPLDSLFNSNVLAPLFKFLHKAHRLKPKLVELFWKAQKGNPLTRTLISLGGFNTRLTPREDIELYIQQVEEMDPAILIHLIQSYQDFDVSSWLHQIRIPALIIAGENDRITPVAEQELLHQLLIKSRLEIVADGSHCPQMDLPDKVNQTIESFISP